MNPFYHVGLVVRRLEPAMQELAAVLQTEWMDITEREIGDWTLRLVFARSGPPFMELIEGLAGSPWDAGDGPRVHHLGWWVADRAADRARLAGLGLRPVVDGAAIGSVFDYYDAPHSGLRIEFVDEGFRTAFLQRWGLPQ
jgi:hypothetical protein